MNILVKAKRTRILSLCLLALGLLSACSSPATIFKPSEDSQSFPYRIEVVYFHRTDQCPCMQTFEDNIRDTILSNFRKELDSGKLTYISIASDDWANGALVAKYNTGLFGLYIVIVNDKTENIVPLEEIWTMTGDEIVYREYLKDIISRYLTAEP
jgi:hypothetical protein